MIICMFLVYTNYPSSQQNPNSEYLETDANVQNESETTDDNLESIIPELEYLHEIDEDKEVDGYIIETYREYEIYKDEEGNVIKQVPTSNFNYLKYKKY
ncbi:hypothetical protein DFO70_11768 [Cytobacillus firmus]|uniref:Uncharacterized protein n=3 Tax=Bacillaceae TaxID=186817 RepID=A0A366JM46_CYTFI|nr:hypothetical protein DFO70_11768 [Cytobacillus firmus]TDX39240.1 hypothetical protein DFO72_11170 [Cytobacillus oceanisediminis]